MGTQADRLEASGAAWKTRLQLQSLKQSPRPASDTFEFAVLGDVEPCRFRLLRWLFNQPSVFPRQIDSIQGHPIDFTVQLGDMVSKGLPHYYQGFFDELGGLKVEKPYLTVIGNHDRSKPNGKSHSTMYRRLFGKSNYFFDHGGARFIVLDSSAKKVTKAQLKWLGLVLDTPLRKLVFTHMPPSLLGLWGAGAAHSMGGFILGARKFVQLMSERGVERVYMGHVHAFGVQDYKGVRYVLTGGGGSALFPSGSADLYHHYLTVTVGPDGVRDRVHPMDGASFTIPNGKVILQEAPIHSLWEGLKAAVRRLADLPEREGATA